MTSWMGALAAQDRYNPEEGAYQAELWGAQQPYRGTPRLDPGLRRAPGDTMMLPAAEKFAGAIAAIPQGIAKLAMTPGSLAKPNPHRQGTEEWYWYEDQKQKTANEWGPEMAVNLFGVGTPMAASGAAGIFGGRLAKTADHAALARAEKMAAEGADKSAIWNDTGWFKGADDKWRFEIPDDKAAIAPRVAEQFKAAHVGDVLPVQNADRFMTHPDAHAAYPDLWRVNTELERGGGYPYQAKGSYVQRESGAEGININAKDLDQARSLNLHELQHAIQEREKFATGGDPHKFVRGYNSILRDLNEQIATINERLGAAAGTPRYTELMAMRGELVREVQKIEGPSGIGARERGFDEYRRLPGEVEARNVEARRDLTAEQRKAQPPWKTQDVPDQLGALAAQDNYQPQGGL